MASRKELDTQRENRVRREVGRSSLKQIQTKNPPRRRREDIDYTFLFIVVLVVAAGLIMLLSASAPASHIINGNSYQFFLKQLGFAAAGFVGMWFVSKIDYRVYKQWSKMIFLICVILLTIVAIPHVGKEINGSRRWLPVIALQPSEFMKPAIAIFFATLIDDGKYEVKSIFKCIPLFGYIGLVVFLMICEPHLSGAIIIAGIAVCIMIAAGMPVKPILASVIPVGAIVVLAVYFFSPVRWERIASFMDPFADIQDTGYQVAQGLYAIGSGGIFGLGLGQSVQKYSYLPEPYNDFIFAIICEELGLIGAICIILLFVFLIVRAMRIAMNAPDRFSTLLSVGIIAQIAIQTTLNIAVATSSVPNTGVALPFFSYGGTSVLTLLLEMGILLNISRYSKKE